MYIDIDGKRYDNIRCRPGGAMVYRGVPENLEIPTTPVKLCADDGFELREDDPADYLRVYLEGDRLVMTNVPEPEPAPEPGPEPTVPTMEDMAEMMVDHEVRLATLEMMGGESV